MDISEVGILIETHAGHRRFLKPCLESVRQLRAPHIVCSYCVPLDIARPISMNELMPTQDVMCLADSWIIQDAGQNVNGWMWLEKAGLSILAAGRKGAQPPKYVFSLEGDCIITRPKGLAELVDLLEAEATDVICAEMNEDVYAGAVSYIGKLDKMISVIDFMTKECRKEYTEEGIRYGNIEGRLGKSLAKMGLKWSIPRNPEHAHFSYGYRGTFGDNLGFRHLHGMDKWRKGTHHPPMPREWYDTRWVGGAELAALEYFWTTGKTDRLLEMGYWDPATEELIAMGQQYRETP